MTTDGAPLWDWLAARSVIPAAELNRMQELHRHVVERRHVDLVELHNLIARVRAQLN